MKAIVVYGTRYGSTPKVAEEIAAVLREGGIEAEAFDAARHPPPPAGYDLVIVGSAIRNDTWTKETLSYLKNHRPALAGCRVALFACCATVLSPNLTPKIRIKYLEDVVRKNLSRPPIATGLFGGCFDFRGRHGIMYSLTSGAFMKDLAARGMDVYGICDFRDWDAIRAWARTLIV
jgi:menaquinone-dependent protoporphyrinogen oxidase